MCVCVCVCVYIKHIVQHTFDIVLKNNKYNFKQKIIKKKISLHSRSYTMHNSVTKLLNHNKNNVAQSNNNII